MKDFDNMAVEEFNPEKATKAELVRVVQEQNKTIGNFEEILDEKNETIESIRQSFMDLQRENIKTIEELEVRVNKIINSYEEKLMGLKGIMQSAILLASSDDYLKEEKGEN